MSSLVLPLLEIYKMDCKTLGVAEMMGIKIVNIRIAPQEIISLGLIRGFFSMNWMSNAGYEVTPIIGYSSKYSNNLMQSGYNDKSAWFDDEKKLNVKNPATGSTMILRGVIIDCNL